MQKIIKQDLCGSEETAKSLAQYTWQKNEIAWYFDTTYRDIFKVEFTGEHWIVGNKWGRSKIYQYKYLESSGEHELNRKGLDYNGISHGNEEFFYTTKQEALTRGFRFIEAVKNEAILTFEKDMNRLNVYEQQTGSNGA